MRRAVTLPDSVSAALVSRAAVHIPTPRRGLSFLARKEQLRLALWVALILPLQPSLADDLTIEAISLPALRINGQPARAHTQGLEIESGKYYVTARRDDVVPRRALLLQTESPRSDWDVWDITPLDAGGDLTALDHPGGLQSDGKRLWIPLAESRRKGRSLIRVFPISGMVAGQPLKAEFEFAVNDHIGAVAVSANDGLVFGASWDTETVYTWKFDGRLHQTLDGRELQSRGLGVVNGANGRAGLAVQDWKVVGDWLFASGLLRGPKVLPESPQSRLMSFASFLEPGFQRRSVPLPKQNRTELAREAMAISDGQVYFLPSDLGASNRVYRLPLADLMKRSVPQESGASQTR